MEEVYEPELLPYLDGNETDRAEAFMRLALGELENAPPSRTNSVTITKLQEALLWVKATQFEQRRTG